MMARIEAQEHLDAIRGRGIAFGGYKPEDAEQMVECLRDKAAGIDRDADAGKPVKATPDALAVMGIGAVIADASAPSERPLSDG